jgi:hypothetical protein
VAYALEDLPEDVREQARMIMDVPAGGSFAKRVIEITIDTVADLYGSLERVKLLHFLRLIDDSVATALATLAPR